MIESVGTIVINTSPDEVFRFLAHRENFPQLASAGSGVRVVILSEGSFGDGTLIQHTQVVSRVSHLQVNQGFETDTIRIHFPSRLLAHARPVPVRTSRARDSIHPESAN